MDLCQLYIDVLYCDRGTFFHDNYFNVFIVQLYFAVGEQLHELKELALGGLCVCLLLGTGSFESEMNNNVRLNKWIK